VQAIQALAVEAAPPLGDRVGITVQVGSNPIIGRLVDLAAAQDEAGTEGQGLRRRVGVGNMAEVLTFFEKQPNARSFPSHEAHSLCKA
jgi:hypothetical protein